MVPASRITAFTTGAAALAVVLAGCGSASTSTQNTAGAPEGLTTPGQLTVCSDLTYPPMDYFENGTTGKEIGFDMDAARAVAKEWGVELKVLNTAFASTIPAMEAGRCDVAWSGLFINDDRLAAADAVPYLASSVSIAVPAGNPKNIKSLDDLAGLRAAVSAGGAVSKQLRAASEDLVKKGLSPAKISEYPGGSEYAALISGKEDVAVDLDIAVRLAAEKSGSLEEISGAFPGTTNFGVYVKKGSSMGPAILTAWSSVVSSGEAARIAKKYNISETNVVTPTSVLSR
ncbi:polar amino acid transport system substrate-binding protein [Arthrobacter sp. cf158]|uniref:transporter substrate-binding domain-containing protein n=1 Tax=Arthrobacter sp. cf158 TaxID=1761744 RepID=UPI00089A5E8C|nr:transporter substrate-binding domain-containing protein [Arthrobacter sp. cf158]SDW92004.1 polar amino acid transport system substrate-binding protein [Arthrobacter sp. cf158]